MANKKNSKKNTSKKSGNTKKNTVKKTNQNVNKNVSKKNTIKNDSVDYKKINNSSNVKSKLKEEKKQTISKARKELVFAESGNDEVVKLVKVVLLVTAVMIVFYFVTSFVTRKANAKKVAQKSKAEKTVIQYENIIIGSMLNKDGEYYVLIEKDDDDNLSEYDTLVQTISVNDEAPKIYKANLTDIFNKMYLSDENNYDSNLSNFKVKGTTLIKVSDHSISETYDNHDSIKSKLDELK